MKTKNERLAAIVLGALSLLLVPLIAMQFTKEVNWDAFDFIVMGFLLTVFGLLIELVLRLVKTTLQRVLFCGGVLIIFFLIWAELAVGIFGSPLAGS